MPRAIRFRKTLLFIFFCCELSLFACRIHPNNSLVVLSGAITSTLRELKLLEDPHLIALSHFFVRGEESESLKKKMITGGFFMSSQVLKTFKDATIIFDKSLEYKKQFVKSGLNSFIEFETRDISPEDVILKSLKELKPFLVGCEENIANFQSVVKNMMIKIKELAWKKKKALFFLGKISLNKNPNMLMVNDGFVRTLLDQEKIISYPAQSAYVIWARKTMNLFSDGATLYFGLEEDQSMKLSIKKIKSNHWNLSTWGIFTPGFGQLRFLYEFIKSDKLTKN